MRIHLRHRRYISGFGVSRCRCYAIFIAGRWAEGQWPIMIRDMKAEDQKRIEWCEMHISRVNARFGISKSVIRENLKNQGLYPNR